MFSKRLDIKHDGIYYVTDRHAIYKCHEMSGPVMYLLRRISDDEWISVNITEEDLQRDGAVMSDFFEKKDTATYGIVRFYGGCPITRAVEYEEITDTVRTFTEAFGIRNT